MASIAKVTKKKLENIIVAATTDANQIDSLYWDISGIEVIPETEPFWKEVTSKSEFMSWFNSVSDKSFVMPTQRITDGIPEYWDGGSWVQMDAIYILETIVPKMETYNITTSTTDPTTKVVTTTTTTKKVFGFRFDTAQILVSDMTRKYNYDTNNHNIKTLPDGTKYADTNLFGNGVNLIKVLLENKDYQNGHAVEKIEVPLGSILGSPVPSPKTVTDENGNTTTITYDPNIKWVYDSSGEVVPAYAVDYYTVEYACGVGTETMGTVCKQTKEVAIYHPGSLIADNYDHVIINEEDVTYTDSLKNLGIWEYPEIKASDFRNIRNALNSYINGILNVASVGVNMGAADTETIADITGFLTGQTARSSTLDPNDPDTSFGGYQAVPGAIIKVDFYNILIDAYRLLLNGCICNADCACNVNCICNTNCACNYTWSF